MRVFIYILSLLSIVITQVKARAFTDSLQFRMMKTEQSTIVFVGKADTIIFEMITKENKDSTPKALVRITDSKNNIYLVSTYFSGFGYHITTPSDSLLSLYRDLPYGELIIDGITKEDQRRNNLRVPSLNCVVSINGVRGKPTLDQGGKTIDTEKAKKPQLKEILITDKTGDIIFCTAMSKLSSSGQMIHNVDFNASNSQRLNERLKLTVLFIFWMYQTKK